MDFLEWLTSKFSEVSDAVFEVLPKSPISFLAANKNVTYYLSFVNWFVPVYLWISILEAWLSAIVVYYICQVILRWIKVIE
ncbi:MAG: hypothetical protein NC078_04970 [Ruminococcus sp.]|nr:hypothetical protein [Ruminococcus sp.]